MRLITYNIEHQFAHKLESENLYIADIAEDFNDLQYHLSVRFYNLVVFYSNNLKKCVNTLKQNIVSPRLTPNIVQVPFTPLDHPYKYLPSAQPP